jgi:hypothetical protein
VFVVACIGPSLLGLNTLLSVNLLTAFQPWQSLYGHTTAGHQLCTGDTIDSVMPGIAYVRTQLYAGHLANWQSLVSGGGQLGSLPNLGLLSPLSWPYFVLPLWLAPAFVKLGELIVAIGGTYLFVRRVHGSRLAASVAGIVFASSGFMVMWTNWPQTRTAAFIPALFWAAERIVQRRRLTDAALLAVIFASMLFGGFPAVTGWAAYFVIAYVIVRVLIDRRGQNAVWLPLFLTAGGFLLGAALSAVQTLPFALSLGQNDLAYRANYDSIKLPATGLLTTISPSAYGLCLSGTTHGPVNPIELVAFVGAGAIVLAVLAVSTLFFRTPRAGAARGLRSYLTVSIGLIVLVTWMSVPALNVVQHLPVFSNNLIGRIRSVFGFLIAILAALGMDILLSRLPAGSTDSASPDQHVEPRTAPALTAHSIRWVWLGGIWLAAATAGVALLFRAHSEAIAGGFWGATRNALIVSLFLVAVACCLVGLAWTRWTGARLVAIVAIPILVVMQSAWFFRHVLPGDDKSKFYPVSGAHQFLAQNQGNDRYDSSLLTLYPATSLYYGLRAATGHAFVEPQWADLLDSVDPQARRTPTFYAFSSRITPANVGRSPILDRMGVKYFAVDSTQISGAVDSPSRFDGVIAVPASGKVTCTLPGGPLRGVRFTFASADRSRATNNINIQVEARSGTRQASGGFSVGPTSRQNVIPTVAIPGEAFSPDQPVSVSIHLTGLAPSASVRSLQGSMSCSAIRPVDDGLKLVYADAGSIIYQRLTALPRIRWASKAIVVPDPATRVAMLAKGVPDGTVVLNSAGSAADGAPATVAVLTDSGDHITTRVQAGGAGLLVVADAMQLKGWSATVDGRSAALVPADHAMVAVAVPTGTHVVRMTYRPPGQRAGFVITGVSMILLIGIVTIHFVRRRRTRSTSSKRPDTVVPSPPDQAEAHRGLLAGAPRNETAVENVV